MQTKGYSRRDLLMCLLAGGVLVAGKWWFPGQKTIFLPTPNKIIHIPVPPNIITHSYEVVFSLGDDLPHGAEKPRFDYEGELAGRIVMDGKEWRIVRSEQSIKQASS